MLILLGSLFVALYGGVLLRHAGLSVLVTDGIQLLCAATAFSLVVREVRVQLARERAAKIPQSRIAKVLVLTASSVVVVVYLLLVIGRTR
jgi:hypothetical protein